MQLSFVRELCEPKVGEIDVAQLSHSGNSRSRSGYEPGVEPQLNGRWGDVVDPGDYPHYRAGEPGHLCVGLGRQRRLGRKASPLLPAKVLLRHLPTPSRFEPASRNQVSPGKVAGQPLGPGRPETAV